ncbi:hypothetical protein [Oscillibacter sp.]|uniref:hypothetical protein n=1 Tax=Oscillibacter sp. TaxID=1945593 RepID=UPI0028B0F035|nr:hypothetical protein [Oscillibacter sp.]
MPQTNEKILSLKHLSEYTIAELITSVGLYEPVAIDTRSENFDNAVFADGSGYSNLLVSDDVRQLYELAQIKSPVLLPCKDCQRELAFSNANAPIPQFTTSTNSHQLLTNNNLLYNTILSTLDGVLVDDYSRIAAEKSLECLSVIAKQLHTFCIKLECSYNTNHTVYAYFSIEYPHGMEETRPAILINYEGACLNNKKGSSDPLPDITEELEKAQKQDKQAEYYLVLQKIGQYPSMADMQFFEVQKYKKLLKNEYKELTRAIGLHASGIGIGAFVYLRRIFENIVESKHVQCLSRENWNEDQYYKMKFNEKLDYLSSFGTEILPEALLPIKNKLYGVLSKGLHEYTETECSEMFPHLELAIELLLDRVLVEKEQAAKIKKMTESISKAKS